jgi:probable addiction module antidote protein
MVKRKTLEKQKNFFPEDMPIIKARPGVKVLPHDPSAFFKDKAKVMGALTECLQTGDTAAYMEILRAFFAVQNRSEIAKKNGVRRATVYEIFKKDANPSFKSVMKWTNIALGTKPSN